MKRIASLVALVLVLASCSGGGGDGNSGGVTTPANPATTPEMTSRTTGGQATATTVALNPLNGSNVSGTATFTEGSGGVEVALAVQGLPTPDASYLTHIHPGTCADALADEATGEEEENTSAPGSTTGVEDIEEPLQPVASDSSGNGTSNTVLPNTTLDELFSVDAPKYVNVHGAGAGEPPPIACGDLNRGGAA